MLVCHIYFEFKTGGLKKRFVWHYDVIVLKELFLTVHTKTIWYACKQFQMNERKAKTHRKVSVFKRKRISVDGFLNDTDQQTLQIL